MKKYLLMIVVLVLVGCADQQLVGEVPGELVEQTPANEISTLIEKARWGDGKAYIELAERYRKGEGVQQDFLMMLGMAFFADDYGGISRLEDYMSTLPDECEYKLVFEVMGIFSDKKKDEALGLAEKLIAQDCTEGYTVKGIILSEQGNKEEGEQFLDFAAGRGSCFAQVYQCVPDWHDSSHYDVNKFEVLAESNPLASMCLGKIYSGRDDKRMRNDSLAAYYYMRADEHAFLSKKGAQWLLDYHRNGGSLKLSETDLKRLEILAGKK